MFTATKAEDLLIRCPACKRENYAMMVSSGQCAWCGYQNQAARTHAEAVAEVAAHLEESQTPHAS